MDQTPRPRPGGFPTTPQINRRPPRYDGPQGNKRTSAPIPQIPPLKSVPQQSSEPLIPEHVLDAPTQRLFAVSAFVLLCTWKFYDFNTLNESEEQSLWCFMKWVAIDGVFLFGLPGLRIPWLEWSSSTMMLLFSAFAVLDGMLMFRIAPPVGAGFAALGRSVYGAYELAVNERSVNPDTIKFNDTLILGRQVIHILPEGTAILNAERQPFCIGGGKTEVRLPITINSTNPISIDLLRTDLETQANETIHISKSQIQRMHKEASRMITYSEKENEPKTLYHSVKKPGLYALLKVVDESNLEVRGRQFAHTVVVPCPRASLNQPSTPNQCRGDLLNVELEVTGTPPLTLEYRKVVDRAAQDATYENIVPDDFYSPLTRQDQNALVIPHRVDTAWARPQTVTVPLSESLATPGKWVYSIREVRDAFGNNVSFSNRDDDDEQDKASAKFGSLKQTITVHERPTVNLQGCSPQQPLKIPKGQKASLPIRYGSTGRGALKNETHSIDYLFTPQDDLSEAGGHKAPVSLRWKLRSGEAPSIQAPGLYTVTGVTTDTCRGEVLEPASCILQNPPEPKLSLQQEEIFDKCAGSPVGLRVDLDLTGTPPFQVHYRMSRRGERLHVDEVEEIAGLRGQIELTPKHAGHYTYEFMEIEDAVYKKQKINGISLQQDVKPSASASINQAGRRKTSCIDDAVSFNVTLQGEGPLTLEYELVRGGKRPKFTLENLEQDQIVVTTPPLTDGGDYTLALVSVIDRMGCKEFLKDEARITVRPQKPKVAFRSIDGVRSRSTLEGSKVALPLRLEGDGPWMIGYLDAKGRQQTMKANNANDRINVAEEGTYELTEVSDVSCPGFVDESAKTFEISWIPRPEMRIPPGDIAEQKGNTLVKREVCEGEEDAVEVLFKGSAPYHVQYVQHVKPTHGTMAPQTKDLRTASNVASLRMDTRQAGLYEYRFSQLKDENYDHSAKHFIPLTVQQRVNPRPSAAFASPGKTYGFCSVESEGEQLIPITLHGMPPFDVEVEIKHHGSARPETVSLSGITGHSHEIRIPHSRLHAGKSAVSLRRVSDSRGCIRPMDSTTPRVQISVHDAPTVTPLESHTDFCVGDRINFGLSGVAPFNVFYTFEGAARKAVASSTAFRRLAEKPGEFVVTGVQDSTSSCKSTTNITKQIHGMPSVRVSKGRDSYVDIHEGGEAEILFEFGGAPPFEFTYTRSSNTEKNGKKRGEVLDMRSETSEEHSMRIMAHEEGTYEVVAIKDRYCAYSKPGVKVNQKEAQKRLMY